jgi:hypothetical protein
MLSNFHEQTGRTNQHPSFIQGSAALTNHHQLRLKEHNGDGEKPYKPDLGAEIWPGTPNNGQKVPTTTIRRLYTPAATPPSPSEEEQPQDGMGQT